MKISVITPSLNPRKDYLDRVFRALDRQTLIKDLWEYIVVDNGSDEPIAGRVDLSWHPHARVLVEPVKGLTRARLKGFDAACGSLVVLVDDDCLLADNYLETAVELMGQYPHIGTLGAYLEGDFETPPPEWMMPFVIMLCAMQYSPERKIEMQYALTRRSDNCTPAGAGMVIRREVVEAYSKSVREDSFRSGLDRTGNDLVGSGDLDIACTSIEMGLATGNSTRLHATHLIPARRMELGYLRRLLYASNYGTARLLVHRGWRNAQPAPTPTLWSQIRRAFGRLRQRPPAEQCWIAFGKGYTDGMAVLPYDAAYR